jgi:hypothetical protein
MQLGVRLLSCLEEGLSKIIENEIKAIYGDDIWYVILLNVEKCTRPLKKSVILVAKIEVG